MKLIIEETDIEVNYDPENISPKGEMLLFDIETTGLRKETTQIYLIGCGYFNARGNFEIRQWLAESTLDEREVVEEFAEFSENFSVLVHFNGDGFDIPYVTYKAEYYGIDLDFTRFVSVDIYKCLKPYKKFLGLERMNQTSLERFLNIERRDVMNGGMLIPYYFEFERTGDAECERLLLLHNNDDVRGMIKLTCALSFADMFAGRFHVREMSVFENTCILEYTLLRPVPVPVLYESKGVMIAAEGDLLQINLAIEEGSARVPLANVEDYYYLPAEDRVIHKDVAAFVGRKYRKKATKKNCFLKKEGRFIPAFKEEGFHGTEAEVCYMPDEKGRLKPYVELSAFLGEGQDAAYEMARRIFSKL